MERDIIEIDRSLCNGCGLCTGACAEGALELDAEGKAVLVREIFCDGLGACLNVCPTGALTVVRKESAAYDDAAAIEHVRKTRGEAAVAGVHRTEPAPHHGCPGSAARSFSPRPISSPASSVLSVSSVVTPSSSPVNSELTQWPVQLGLVSPDAPYWEGADLLIAADCTAFALASFHRELLAGKKIAIACPKLDDTGKYVSKIAEIIKRNTIYSLTVAIMEVPCCSGLKRIVNEAVALSGKDIAVKVKVVGIEGVLS